MTKPIISAGHSNAQACCNGSWVNISTKSHRPITMMKDRKK